MRIMLSVVATSFMMLASSASADPAPKAEQDPPTDVSEAVVVGDTPMEDPVICRRQKPTGSSIAVKVCLNHSQWIAKSTRGPKVSEVVYADGMDDKYAPAAQAR